MPETQFNPWVRKILWRRAWQPTPVFLPGEFHGQRDPVDYSPWGRKGSNMIEWLTHTQNRAQNSSTSSTFEFRENAHSSYFHFLLEQDRLPPGKRGLFCHQNCSVSSSNPGVIYTVSTGTGQVSAGTISKEKPIPWNQQCKEEGSWWQPVLCWIIFRSSRLLHPRAFFFSFFFLFAKRKLKDKHLKEKLIPVTRWQAVISPQGACQGGTDVSVRTMTRFKRSGEQGGGGVDGREEQKQKSESSLQGSWLFLKGCI